MKNNKLPKDKIWYRLPERLKDLEEALLLTDNSTESITKNYLNTTYPGVPVGTTVFNSYSQRLYKKVTEDIWVTNQFDQIQN